MNNNNFKNTTLISGYLVDLKLDINHNLIGVIKQYKTNEANEEFHYYFNFVLLNPTLEQLEKFKKAYHIETFLDGVDLKTNAFSHNNNDLSNHLLQLKGELAFNDLTPIYEHVLNELKQTLTTNMQLSYFKQLQSLLKHSAKEMYLIVQEFNLKENL